MKRYFFVNSLFDSYNADDVDDLIEEKDKEIRELEQKVEALKKAITEFTEKNKDANVEQSPINVVKEYD